MLSFSDKFVFYHRVNGSFIKDIYCQRGGGLSNVDILRKKADA